MTQEELDRLKELEPRCKGLDCCKDKEFIVDKEEGHALIEEVMVGTKREREKKVDISRVNFWLCGAVVVVMWVAAFVLKPDVNIESLGLVSAALLSGVPVNMIVDKFKR